MQFNWVVMLYPQTNMRELRSNNLEFNGEKENVFNREPLMIYLDLLKHQSIDSFFLYNFSICNASMR